MQNDSYDIIIIGSGAGGGTIAQALAGSGARILIVERGTFVPQEEENWSPVAVWKDLRYRTTEQWIDEGGRSFRPYTHYCCLLYTSPSPRDGLLSRMPSSA